MKSVLLVTLGILLLVVTAAVMYEQGRRNVVSQYNAMLCNDALVRRQQVGQALSVPRPPAVDALVIRDWDRRMEEVNNQRRAADDDLKRYC